MNAVVTGATGFIGRVLCEKLLVEGHTVWGVGRNSSILGELNQNPLFHSITLDFRQIDNLANFIRVEQVDEFYHLGWTGAQSHANDIDVQIGNIEDSVRMLTTAKKIHAGKFLFTGSIEQYKFTTQHDTIKVHCSAYGIAKNAAAEMLRFLAVKSKLPYVSVVLPRAFGAGDKPISTPVKITKQLLANEVVKLTDDTRLLDWVYVGDVADGIIAAMRGFRDRYVVGNEKWRCFSEYVYEMKAALSSQSEVIIGAYPDYSYTDYSQLDIPALYADTGYKPKTSISAATLELAEWLRNEASIMEGI